MATIPRPPIITRLRPTDPANTAAVQSQAWVWQNPLTTIFMGLGAPPPSTNYDWPNPRGYIPVIDLRTWAWGVPLNLVGQDQFFGLPGNPNYDWPNPRGYIPAIDLKTWAWPVNLNLLNQDKFFGLAGAVNFNWPVPSRGYIPAIDLRTWTQSVPLNLLGKDQFFGLAGHPNYDWPNPRGTEASIELRASIRINPAILPVIPEVPSLAFSSDAAAYKVTASTSASGQNWSGAGYMAQYEIDTSVVIEGVFLNALAGVYIDPTAVSLFIIDPSGGRQTQTLSSGAVIRDSLGHFHFTFTPTKSGVWTYKWQGTGAAVATSPDTMFTINPSALIAG